MFAESVISSEKLLVVVMDTKEQQLKQMFSEWRQRNTLLGPFIKDGLVKVGEFSMSAMAYF